jgi:hypothetical protein
MRFRRRRACVVCNAGMRMPVSWAGGVADAEKPGSQHGEAPPAGCDGRPACERRREMDANFAAPWVDRPDCRGSVLPGPIRTFAEFYR